jgi:hypothetical protein
MIVSLGAYDFLLIAGGLLLCSVPLGLHFAGRNQPSLPLLAGFTAYLAIFFVAAPLLAGMGWSGGAVILYGHLAVDGFSRSALLFLLAGIAALIACYLAALAGPGRHLPSVRLPETAYPPVFRLFLWLMLSAHFIDAFIPGAIPVPSIGNLLQPAGIFALGGLYLAWRRGRLTLAEKLVICCVALPLTIYDTVRVLLLTELILKIAFFCILLLRERQFRLLCFCALVVVTLLAAYRFTTAYRSYSEVGAGRFEVVGGAVKDAVENTEASNPINQKIRHDLPGGVASLVRRIGQFWVFQHVYDNTPFPVPFWEGETVRPLLTAWIPRVLYPGKPEETAGNRFGVRYSLLSEDSIRTSVNVPWPTELLANFGTTGLITGMAMIGVVMALLLKVVAPAGAGDMSFLTAAAVFHPMIYPESNISVTVGTMPQLYLIFCLFVLVAVWIERRI